MQLNRLIDLLCRAHQVDAPAWVEAQPTDSAAGGGADFDFATATALESIMRVMEESEAVEAHIDRVLDGGDQGTKSALIQAMARAGVAWEHPALLEALALDATRQAAAMVVARATPGALDHWLGSCEVVEDALEVMRAISLAGDMGALADWPSMLEWHEALLEVDGAGFERARATGAIAVLDPTGWARLALAGEADERWLSDPEMVADFLSTHGPTDWLGVLAALEGAESKEAQTREFAALLAAAAAMGLSSDEAPGDEALGEAAARELIALLQLSADAKSDAWEPRATRLGLAGPLALTGGDVDASGDEGLGLLLVQVAAHERLIGHDFHSPGIPGLPFSATDPADVDRTAARELLANLQAHLEDSALASPSAIVMVLRTFEDIKGHMAGDPELFAPEATQWAEAFAESTSPALSRGAAHLKQRLESAPERDADRDQTPAALAHQARQQSPAGLDAARKLAALGGPGALERLAHLWAEAAMERAGFYRDCLLEAALSANFGPE